MTLREINVRLLTLRKLLMKEHGDIGAFEHIGYMEGLLSQMLLEPTEKQAEFAIKFINNKINELTTGPAQASSKSGLAIKSPGLSGPVLKERVVR